ncbi:MAG: hypothetical protein J6W03_09500 [Bacteroidaceae bacterium]|nr:hypothetical protein [Bacteroidaceae bacterium]
MNKRKHCKHPSAIVDDLSGKGSLMDYMSQDPAGVREYRGHYDKLDEE